MKYVFKSEGGFVDDRVDRGGRTNYGVTQNTYNVWRKNKGLPNQDVKNITQDEAKQLYYEEYWKPTGASEKKDLRAGYELFDTAIIAGPYNAKQIDKKSNGDIYKFLEERKKFHENDIRKHPSQERFREGWNNRINDMRNNMDDMVNQGYYRPPYYNEATPYDNNFGDINLKKPAEIRINGQVPTEMQIQSIKNKYQYYKHKNEMSTGYASPVENTFTPAQIGSMTQLEFAQNEPAIMTQLQQGMIGNPESDLVSKYSGYTNPLTGGNRIYSAEDIGNLSGSEFTKLEPEINAQWGSIGIPSKNELSSASGGGGTVYVEGYTRSDGTEVQGYYRSR